jgi:hypothetical protein
VKKYYYTVDDPIFDDYLEWNHPYDHETPREVIEDCAQEYENNSNWEDATEADFYLWKRDEPEDEPELLGKFTVYREFSSYFTAYEKE